MVLPEGKKVLKIIWVFKLKKDEEKLAKCKPYLVIKGFNKKKGTNFNQIFSLILKMSSI